MCVDEVRVTDGIVRTVLLKFEFERKELFL